MGAQWKHAGRQASANAKGRVISKLAKEERIKGIREIRDESSARNGEPVKIVVYLKRDGDPNLILNQLYQFSPLEQTTSIILLALVNGRPERSCVTTLEPCTAGAFGKLR